MAIDSHYIPAFSIEDVLLDKDTGAPLSGGLVYFEQDNQRGVLKPVYQITGTSPNYSYTQLPNPMTLSSIGTFEDALGNPVVPYFFPYDDEFDVEYYYVRVTSSEDVEQFTREAVPYISVQDTDEVLSVITNELSNPQFIEVLFDTSAGAYTYNVNTVTDSVIRIAPDWDLIVSAPGAGTVTVTQLKPSGSLNILTNPGTILTINSAGLTKLQLRQRISGSPNLWGSGYLSASFVAKTYSGTAVTLNLYYSQSSGTVIDQLLVSASLPASGNYGSFSNSVLIPPSNSSGTYPTAYVDIFFDIPLSTQVDITSVMTAFTGATSIQNIAYDQESTARQIDQLYHYAYPIVPIGTIIDFHKFTIPPHYLLTNGVAYSRIDYYLLFSALTKVENVILTIGVNTFTVVSSVDYWIGMPVEGVGIPASTTISGIAGTTITISNNATASGVTAARFFSAGAGDGSTTFNVPDLTDYVVAQNNGTLFGSGNNGVGAKGGTKTHTLLAAELPPHTHTYQLWTNQGVGGFGMAGGTLANYVSTATGNGPGASTPFSIVQQTVLMKKLIRYQ